MLLTLILLFISIFLILEEKIYDITNFNINKFIDEDLITFLKFSSTTILIIWLFIVIPIARISNNEKFTVYSNFIENYEKFSNNSNDVENATLTIEFIKIDNQIKLYKKQNNTWGDILISDKELNKLLEERKNLNLNSD